MLTQHTLSRNISQLRPENHDQLNLQPPQKKHARNLRLPRSTRLQPPDQWHRQNQDRKVRYYIDRTDDDELDIQVHATRLDGGVPVRVDGQALQQIDHCRSQAIGSDKSTCNVENNDEEADGEETLVEQEDRKLSREDGGVVQDFRCEYAFAKSRKIGDQYYMTP